MNIKKLRLPALILLGAILAMVALSILLNIAKKPTVTGGTFDFSITYELGGVETTISGVYRVSFVGHDGDADTKTRIYSGKIDGKGEDQDSSYVLSDTADGMLVLCTNLEGGYLMGDPQYGYYFDEEAFAPTLVYYATDGGMYAEPDEVMDLCGARIVDFAYPEQIENSFVFSHISTMNSIVVAPTTALGIVAIVLILIFVKRSGDVKATPLDRFSVLANFAVGIVVVPVLMMICILLDLAGGGESFFHQAAYFGATLTTLFLAASVALRRTGFSKTGFSVQFLGPALFVLFVNFASI